jgi:hypothetical protein
MVVMWTGQDWGEGTTGASDATSEFSSTDSKDGKRHFVWMVLFRIHVKSVLLSQH